MADDGPSPEHRWRAHPGHGHRPDGYESELDCLHRCAEEADIYRAAGELACEVHIEIDVELDIQTGIAPLELMDDGDEGARRDSLSQANLDHPLHHAGASSGEPEPRGFGHDNFGMHQQLARLDGELNLAADAVEQRHIELFFELPDARRNAGLRGIQALGRGAERPELRDPVEGLELANVHQSTATGASGLPVPPTIGSGKAMNKNSVAPLRASGSSTSPSIRATP